MSEEIPPSYLATGSSGRPIDRGHGSRYLLRLTAARWDAIAPDSPWRAATVVIGAWLIMAWSRFGFQGLTVPRVMVRFVLIGVYGWLGLALVLWVGRALVDRLAGGTTHGPGVGGSPIRLLQITGLSHQAVLVLGLAVLIGQAIPIPLVVPALAAFTVVVWIPGALLAATISADGGVRRPSIGVTGLGYLLWLVTAGRYLFDQIEHLI